MKIYELPSFLYPLQKNMDKPFKIDFPEGERTQALGAYLFHLVNKGYTAEQAFEIVRLMNQYIFDKPIPDDLLNSQILNDKTFEKLAEMEMNTKKKDISPEVFKRFLAEKGMMIKYNELLNIVEFENVPEEYRNVTDIQNVMPIKLQYGFRRYTGLKNISKQQVTDLIVLEADENSYNPIKNYLQEFPWDGVDRFPELFKIVGIQEKFEQCLIKKWFYQSAILPFNTLENPIQPEGVLIFKGDEGICKTRFFRTVAVNPLWFKSLDKPMSTKNKDTLIETLSSWITEIGEIDRTFTEKRSDLKSFMTAEKDTIRKPYAREPITKARTTSICGTTNKAEFLNDETGSRRWWVVHIPGKIDIDKLVPEFLSHLWAQCYAAISDNPLCFRLADEERQELENKNEDVMTKIPAEEELRYRLDFDAPIGEWQWIQPSVLKNHQLEYDVEKYKAEDIGKALTVIMKGVPQMQKKRTKSGTKYFIPPAVRNTDRNRNV